MNYNEVSLVAGMACSALEEGNLDSAVMLFTRAIDLDGGNAALYELRGTAYSMQKDWRSAIGDFDRAIRLAPSAGAYSSRAYAHQNMDEHDRAIGDFDAAISMAAGDDQKRHYYYSMRGSAHLGKGDLDRAIEDFGKAISIQDLAPFRSQRGLAYEEKGLYDKALADLEQAIRLDPGEQDWRDQRDFVLESVRAARAKAAQEPVAAPLTETPAHREKVESASEKLYQSGWESRSKYGRTHDMGDLLEAARLWREAAGEGHMKAKLWLADLYSNPSFPDHRPDEAVGLLTEIMAECPDSDPCWQRAAADLGLMHCEGRTVPRDTGKGWGLISKALQVAKPEDLSATTAIRVALLCSIGVPSSSLADDPSVEDLVMAVKYFGLAAELAEREGAAEEYRNLAREQRDAHVDRLKSKATDGPPAARGELQNATIASLRRHNLNDTAARFAREWGLQITDSAPAQGAAAPPSTADQCLQSGEARLERGDYEGAIGDFDRAASLEPGNAMAYSMRAFAYNAKGDCDRAIEDFGRAIYILPEDATLLYMRGTLYANQGRDDKALADLDRAIQLRPGYSEAIEVRASLGSAIKTGR